MTGTPFDGSQSDASGAELLLHARFEDAVRDLSPDIARLVADGASDGRGVVRRRRLVTGISAAAVAVVAIGGVSLATQTDLLGKDDHATDTGQLEQLVPATPRGMTAALLAHTDAFDLGTPIAVGGTETTQNQQPELSGQVAYDLGDGKGVEIDVFATRDLTQINRSVCSGVSDHAALDVCRPFTLTNGDQAWYVVYGSAAIDQSGSQAALSGVIAVRSDEAVVVVETMNGTTDFVLDQDALAAIVADPAIGMSTTDAFNTAGNRLSDFKEDGLTTTEGDNGASTGGGSASPPTVKHRRAPSN